MLDGIQKDAELRMQKSIEMLGSDLSKLRTGRAHPSLLENIEVSYYGQPTALNQVSTIAIADPRTLAVTPFEKNMVEVVEKAIRSSELGLNPATAGQVIRIPLPPLTEERRKLLTKQMKTEVEGARVAVRNIRRDANTKFKNLLKQKTISEDEERVAQDKVQKMTDKYIGEIEQMAQTKESELMQV